jgi:hypothetical protein
MFIKYIFNAMLPNRIFFTGVPGSRWSGIAQTLEQLDGFNTSDRTPARSYNHNQYSGHKGAYFGTGMELEAYLDERYIDYAWAEQGGTRIVKSHDWAYKLDLVRQQFPNDWIMLVIDQTWPAMLGGMKQADLVSSILVMRPTKTAQLC